MGDERLGRYTVLKHLAQGGMAEVLLGRTDGIEGFERHVVLKRIRADHAKDQRFIQMFLDEARVAATLHHQNIVQVQDVGESGGEYFIAMEYIHGEDLRRLLSAVSKKRVHMPFGHVAAIVGAAAAGLHYAHERKDNKGRPLDIVHRDVSPSNILVGYDGAVKVVDFGIAKAAMRQVETRSGSLKGKVSYMSPEQCKGDQVDRRSDVFALGILLYELATTTRLFKGDNDYILMDAIVHGKIPLPRVKRPDLPSDLEAIILKALHTDPAKRYQTADELRVALDKYAAKANVTAATSAIASYMVQTFGERPEPWLDDRAPTESDTDDSPGSEIATAPAHVSWTEVPRTGLDVADTAVARPAAPIVAKQPVKDSFAPPIATQETRTSMNMAFESQVKPAAKNPIPKVLFLAIPMVAIAGLTVWQLALKNRPHAAPVIPVAETPTARSEPAPSEPAAPVIPGKRVVGFAGPDDSITPAPPTKRVVGPGPDAKKIEKAPPAIKVATPTPIEPPPVAPTPVAPPPPPPVVTEPEVAVLASSAVALVATNHARDLAKCEGSASLHGDVTITFQIDGTGAVVKSQLASTIKNPAVAGCIVKALQSWKFPKAPTGAANGVYSINYQ